MSESDVRSPFSMFFIDPQTGEYIQIAKEENHYLDGIREEIYNRTRPQKSRADARNVADDI